MNQEQLLQRLNNNPIKVNANLIKYKNYDHKIWMQNSEELIMEEMMSRGMKIDQNFMIEKYMIEYINHHLIAENNESLFPVGKINLNVLQVKFPNDSIILSYLRYRKNKSRIKQNEALLKHIVNGYIQPVFAINSAGSIYTAKPSLQIPHSDLTFFFDCTYYHFETLEKAMNAIANAKKDTEIVTVIKKTVYYRNTKYFEKKDKRRQELIEESQKDDFIPFFSYTDDFELEYLGLSHLI